jgi:hypothetical protein
VRSNKFGAAAVINHELVAAKMKRYIPKASAKKTRESSTRAARRYIARGWKPLPVSRGRKGPTTKGWPEWQVGNADDYIKAHFTGVSSNVAIQLGAMSVGLTDVDLDCPEAMRLALEFLPETQAIFGRTSKRCSHWFYVTDLHGTEQRASIPFKESKALNPQEAMLVELRCGAGSKGACTLVPPSVHPSGEAITWENDGEPAKVSGDDLKKRVALLAAATLLVRHNPASGDRHTATLVLGGVLARAQWKEEDIVWFVDAVAKVAGDEEVHDRVATAASAVKHLAAGEDTPGLPRMGEEWGTAVADLFAKWIGYDANGVPDAPDDHPHAAPPTTQTGELLALAEEAALFHSKEGICYADVQVNGHRETWPIGVRGSASGGFALWLRHRFYEVTGAAPNPQALTAALSTLAARALYDGPVHEVYVRVAAHDNRVYLDLADEEWRVVEIDANGWRVTTDAPVRFLRRRGMLPLPLPVVHDSSESRRGALDKLWKHVNVATEDDFALLISCLLQALSGRGPYVVLLIMGEPGAAKSTLERILKELVDPNKAPLRAPPRELRDVCIAANNSYLLAFDNLSDLPDWLSDMLCRLSTGGGFGTRQLYTDEEEMLFDAMRPVVITCVDNVIVRGDLTDRAIFLTLLAIPDRKRRAEREFWAEFDCDKPAILGALLDAVAGGLRELPHVELLEHPRMADFAKWATACERAGAGVLWDQGMFADAYALNRASAAQSVIEEDLVANAIRRLMQKHDSWEGGADALLRDLNGLVSDTVKEHRKWPKASNSLSRRMNKAMGVLRKIGIEIQPWFTEKTNLRRWTINHMEAKEARDTPKS